MINYFVIAITNYLVIAITNYFVIAITNYFVIALTNYFAIAVINYFVIGRSDTDNTYREKVMKLCVKGHEGMLHVIPALLTRSNRIEICSICSSVTKSQKL